MQLGWATINNLGGKGCHLIFIRLKEVGSGPVNHDSRCRDVDAHTCRCLQNDMGVKPSRVASSASIL